MYGYGSVPVIFSIYF